MVDESVSNVPNRYKVISTVLGFLVAMLLLTGWGLDYSVNRMRGYECRCFWDKVIGPNTSYYHCYCDLEDLPEEYYTFHGMLIIITVLAIVMVFIIIVARIMSEGND